MNSANESNGLRARRKRNVIPEESTHSSKKIKTPENVTLANGKPISSQLLSLLKQKIADSELKKKQRDEESMELRKRLSENSCPSVRRADHQTVETEKEEVKEDRQQRDTDTYASLKLALQSRLYGILLNWDLFIPAQPLPILPSSFQSVEEYISLFSAFVLQEVHAQTLQSINT